MNKVFHIELDDYAKPSIVSFGKSYFGTMDDIEEFISKFDEEDDELVKAFREYINGNKDVEIDGRVVNFVVYNKIDKTDFLIDNSGNAQIGAAIKNIKDLYPGIFVPFKNTQPIVSWFKPYNCDFTVFQTGDYTKTDDNTIVFQQGADVFPRRLWSIIIKHVRG